MLRANRKKKFVESHRDEFFSWMKGFIKYAERCARLGCTNVIRSWRNEIIVSWPAPLYIATIINFVVFIIGGGGEHHSPNSIRYSETLL